MTVFCNPFARISSSFSFSFFFFLLFFLILLSPSLALSASGEIKVGAVFPMTGPIATYGQESINGMRLALKKINQEKVLGKTIKLLKEDNKGEPIETANAVRKLIDIDKVVTVLGSVASSNTLAGAPIAQEAKVPLLTPASTNEKVTEMGDFVARICFTDSFQGEVMAKFAFETLKKKKAVIIIDHSSDYSKGLAEVFKKKFEGLGGKVVDDEFSYQQKDTDFSSLLVKVKRARPDVIFVPGYYSEVGLILKKARSMHLRMPVLGCDGWDSPLLHKLAGRRGVQNTFISSHFAADDSDPMVQNFVNAYKKEFKERPGAMAALGYDALLFLAEALRRTKNLNPPEIKQSINTTKNFKGVTGLISLNEKRNAVKSAVVLKVTNTSFKFETKVSP